MRESVDQLTRLRSTGAVVKRGFCLFGINLDMLSRLISYHERHAGNSLGDSPACHSWHECEATLSGRQRLLV